MGDRVRFEEAIAAIDAANADDPASIEFRGVVRPKELVHAELMTAWVTRLAESPSEAQLLAARAHHLRRWVVPRSSCPEDRPGQLQWRRDQQTRRAAEVAEILQRVGYDMATIERVGVIVANDGPGDDAELQVHQDALCLVFLQTHFDPVATQPGDATTVEMVRTTLAEMSPAGRSTALGLELSEHGRALVEAVLIDG